MTDVLVVGGGLAGAAAALALVRSGRRVVLLEREVAPVHKVCGEFLSAEALDCLETFGVDVAALGAVALGRVRVADGRGAAVEAALPFRAASLTRLRLDAALLSAAGNAGVDVRRGAEVQRLAREGGRWQAQLAGGERIEAPDAVLAAGKHELRGYARAGAAGKEWLAFKMYWRLQPLQAAVLEGAVELALFRGGYAGLQPVEEGAVNLCCAVRREAFRRLGGNWAALLAHMQAESPHLSERLAGAEPLLAKPLAIASIPYGWIREDSEDGLWCVGDQAAVIPSFTGDGMALALASAAMAARQMLAGGEARAFQREFAGRVRSQMRVAGAVAAMAGSTAGRLAVSPLLHAFPGLLRQIAVRTRFQSAAAFSGGTGTLGG